MPDPRSAEYWLEAVRLLATPARPARDAAKRALSASGFAIDTESFARIEASRGSQWRVGLDADELPTYCVLGFEQVDARLRVRIHLFDRDWSPIGSTAAARAAYERAFRQVLADLDDALDDLDGLAAPDFAPATFHTRGASPQLLADTARHFASAKDWMISRADRLLGGRTTPAGVPIDLAELSWVLLDLPDQRSIQLSAEEFAGILSVAHLVARQPGGRPDEELTGIERVGSALTAALAALAARPQRVARLSVPQADAEVINFLREQAFIREELPVRRLMTCLDCRTEKLINDDYQRLLERNRRLRLLMGNLDTFVSPKSSLFVLAGAAHKFSKDDPSFVCQSCQGLRAEARMITFCPHCGKRQDDGVLATCDCGHEFGLGIADQIARLDAERTRTGLRRDVSSAGAPPPQTRPPSLAPALPQFGPADEVRLLFWWRSGGFFQDALVIPTMIVLRAGQLTLLTDTMAPIVLPVPAITARARRFDEILTIQCGPRRFELLSRPISGSPPPKARILAEIGRSNFGPTEPRELLGWLAGRAPGQTIAWQRPGDPDWRQAQLRSGARASWFAHLLGQAGARLEPGL